MSYQYILVFAHRPCRQFQHRHLHLIYREGPSGEKEDCIDINFYPKTKYILKIYLRSLELMSGNAQVVIRIKVKLSYIDY